MKYILMTLLLITLVFTSCSSDFTNTHIIEEEKTNTRILMYKEGLQIIPICEDGLVCYYVKTGYGAGMSCIKDVELFNKYCLEVQE